MDVLGERVVIGQAVVAAAIVIVLYVVVPIVTVRRRRRATLAVAWALYRCAWRLTMFGRMLASLEQIATEAARALASFGVSMSDASTSMDRLRDTMRSLPSASKLPRRFSPTVSPTGGVSDDD